MLAIPFNVAKAAHDHRHIDNGLSLLSKDGSYDSIRKTPKLQQPPGTILFQGRNNTAGDLGFLFGQSYEAIDDIYPRYSDHAYH